MLGRRCSDAGLVGQSKGRQFLRHFFPREIPSGNCCFIYRLDLGKGPFSAGISLGERGHIVIRFLVMGVSIYITWF